MTTVKVRVAVVVAANGEWCATGWDSESPSYSADAMRNAREMLHNDGKEYWLTAELEVPEVETVAADVQEEK